MTDQPIPQKLPNCGLLAELDKSIITALTACGKFETLELGHSLVKQNDPHHSLSIVIAGKCHVSCFAHGDTVDLATVGPGGTIGEMSVIDPQKASASVTVCEGPAVVWTIDGDAFDSFLERDYQIGFTVMRALARELCRRIRHDSDSRLKREEDVRVHFRDMDY